MSHVLLIGKIGFLTETNSSGCGSSGSPALPVLDTRMRRAPELPSSDATSLADQLLTWQKITESHFNLNWRFKRIFKEINR